MVLSAVEFGALQDQLNGLKTQLYESKAKEAKLQSLGLQWKQKCKSLDEEFQKVYAEEKTLFLKDFGSKQIRQKQ